MLADHLNKLVTQNLGHEPTPGQKSVIDKLCSFILNEKAHAVFLLKGFAGTGKTSVISALVRSLDSFGIKTLLLAPTGRAAKVFSSYAGKIAYTIHRKIYRQKTSKDGFGEFVLNKNLYSNTLIIVDEASMISDTLLEGSVFGSGRLLADLIQFVREGQNCRIIFTGDTAQLPPVGIILSPALDKNELSLYLRVSEECMLTDIVRQNSDSGILQNATQIRNQINNDILSVPRLKHRKYKDIDFISGADLGDVMEKAYSSHGIEDVVVICRSNKRANQYNGGIRKQILYREEELTKGDLLMVVKNNYFCLKENKEIDFIANGDIIKLKKVIRYAERYGFRFAYAAVTLLDYNIDFEAWIMLDTLMADSPALSQEDNRKLYFSVLEDYMHLESKAGRYKAVKENEFFNALQVKYAYAITCHKAQGGQWKTVFLDQGYMKPENINQEYLRWLYTAVTRATDRLYFVGFPDDFRE